MILQSIGEEYSDTIAEGLVCYQNFSAGTPLDPGTPIVFKISLGRDPAAGITYKCTNVSIEAPTIIEAPDYSSGSEVHVTLVTDAGKVLMDVTTSSFPLPVNVYGITSQWGTITLTYTSTVNGVSESKSVQRRIEFVPE